MIFNLKAEKIVNCPKCLWRFRFDPDTAAAGYRFTRVPDRRAQPFHRGDSRRIRVMHEMGYRKITRRKHSDDVFEVHLHYGDLIGILRIFRRHLNHPAIRRKEKVVNSCGLAEPHALMRFAALDHSRALGRSRYQRQRECSRSQPPDGFHAADCTLAPSPDTFMAN
jgi:hypothetical protein